MKTSSLTPTRLRAILGISMLLLLAVAVGLFTYGYQVIADYSADTRTTAAQAQASSTVLLNMQKTKTELTANAETVARASQIVAESKSYVYQDQIIRDINNFANNSGITITNISFADAKVSPTAVSAPPATAGGSAANTTSASPAGVKSMTATVTLKNPIKFTDMLKFIHSIEGGLFKMRISQVTLSRASTDAANTDEVTSDALTIEVYVR